jgi:hypothetical protein
MRQRLIFCAALFAVAATSVCSTAWADPSLSGDDLFYVDIDFNDLIKDVPKGRKLKPPKVYQGTMKLALLRDHKDPFVFYYVPSFPLIGTREWSPRPEPGQPRVTEEVPEFSLTRYQFTDRTPKVAGAAAGSGYDEGGILQFSVQLALPTGAVGLIQKALSPQVIDAQFEAELKKLEAMVKAVEKKVDSFELIVQSLSPDDEAKRKKVEESRKFFEKALKQAVKEKAKAETKVAMYRSRRGEKIKISPVPITKSEVTFYTPDTGTLLKKATTPKTVGPAYATQRLTQTLELTRNGTALFDALVMGEGGVNCVYTIEHPGMSPAASFKVKIDWKKVQDVMVNDRQYSYAEGFGHCGWTETVEVNDKSRELFNKFSEGDAIEIEAILDPTVIADADLLAMQKQAIADMKERLFPKGDKNAPAAIDPATGFAAPAAAKVSGRDSLTITNTSHFKALVEQEKTSTTEYVVRKRLSKTTSFGGFIGIGSWVASRDWIAGTGRETLTKDGKAEMRKRGLLTYAYDTGFEFLNLTPPTVSVFNELEQVTHTVEVQDQAGRALIIEGAQQTLLTWNPNSTKTGGAWTDATGRARTGILVPLGQIGFTTGLDGLKIKRTNSLQIKGEKMLNLAPATTELRSGSMGSGDAWGNLEKVMIDAADLESYFDDDGVEVGDVTGYLNRCTLYVQLPNESKPRQITWRRNTKLKSAPTTLPTPSVIRFDGADGSEGWNGKYKVAVKYSVKAPGTKDIWWPTQSKKTSTPDTWETVSDDTLYVDLTEDTLAALAPSAETSTP